MHIEQFAHIVPYVALKQKCHEVERKLLEGDDLAEVLEDDEGKLESKKIMECIQQQRIVLPSFIHEIRGM